MWFLNPNILHKKWVMIIGNLIAPLLSVSFVYFITNFFRSSKEVWQFLFLMNFIFGTWVVYAMVVAKNAEMFYVVRAVGLLCIVSAIVYGTSVVITVNSNIIKKEVFIGYLLIVVVEWWISFFYQQMRLQKALEDEPDHALDTKSGILDLQKDFVYSSKDSDKSKDEKILAIGWILLCFAPAVGALMSRELSDNQRIFYYAIGLSILGILFTHFSGLHAGTARIIKGIREKIGKKIVIKTLE